MATTKMDEIYDSTEATLDHIKMVQWYMRMAIKDLMGRAGRHDFSKLLPPEKTAYDIFTPRLASLTYGSEEYKACLAEMRPAVEHHYSVNDHHPEHYQNGIAGMSLLSLLEMLCDWKAASHRHSDGNIADSFVYNQKRWGISDEVMGILIKTADELGIL